MAEDEEKYIQERIKGFEEWYAKVKGDLDDVETEAIEDLRSRLDIGRLPVLDVLAIVVMLVNERLR